MNEPVGVTPRTRAILALNGMLGILAGLLGGFAFTFSILGFIEIFPFLPRIDTTVPGTEAAWRAVHSGSIMNGLLLIALAAVGQLIRLGTRGQRVLLWTAVITVWGNIVGYYTAAIGGDRGLQFGIDWENTLAYFSFAAAAIAVLIAVGLAITGIIRELRFR
jgi:hypothetical protein